MNAVSKTCPECNAPVRPDTGEQVHYVGCPHHSQWVLDRVLRRRKAAGKVYAHGRRFERYDSYGGHGGPYRTLFSAVRDAIRRIRGDVGLDRCSIRDRAKTLGVDGYIVATVERCDASASKRGVVVHCGGRLRLGG